MTPASFHPAAEAELLAAMEYYDSRATGLGRAYLDEAERTLLLLRRFPAIGPTVEADVRRFALSWFPFSLIYRFTAGEIRVLAMMHHSQRPGYWRERR